MASRPDPAVDPTDAEKRDRIALIQAGKPLPGKYRFVLIEDKREVDLMWNGKTRDVCTTLLPFQTLEHVDEPRVESKTPPQSEPFDARGRQTSGWTNKLIWGDNKLTLSSLKSGPTHEQIEDAGDLKVMCEDGPLYKVAESKAGVVSRDRLATTRLDWVDYCAVDIDYGCQVAAKVIDIFGSDTMTIVPVNMG